MRDGEFEIVLPQHEADEFIAAEKVVPTRPWSWNSPGPAWASARFPVEARAAQVGELILVASTEVAAHWCFKLTHRGEEVYRLDVRPIGNHSNPYGRPSGFPKTVDESVHEHLYVEGLGMRCARPLGDQVIGSHGQMFGSFCDQTNIAFRPQHEPPPYVAPRLGPT